MRLIADAAQVWMVRDGAGGGGPDWADTLSEVGGAKKTKQKTTGNSQADKIHKQDTPEREEVRRFPKQREPG